MTDKTINTTRLLRDILARTPKASLYEIRRAHPIFQTMSVDHLGLRLSQMLERTPDAHAK